MQDPGSDVDANPRDVRLSHFHFPGMQASPDLDSEGRRDSPSARAQRIA